MTATEEYLTVIQPRIDAAVQAALPVLADGLANKIREAAETHVYSYAASPEAMKTRRGMIGERSNLQITYGSTEVEIKNITQMQEDAGNETEIVESGDREYGQPYPRPFMNEALDAYVDGGQGENDLADVLRAAGFTVS